MMLPEKIKGSDLEHLTGLSDRRHRQLAQAGYFPKPAAGEYECAATLKGLFRHYRDLMASRSTLEAASLRKRLAEAELRELEVGERKKQLLPATDVIRVWGSVVMGLKAIIRGSHLTDPEQRECLRQIKEFTLDDYAPENDYETDPQKPDAPKP